MKGGTMPHVKFVDLRVIVSFLTQEETLNESQKCKTFIQE